MQVQFMFPPRGKGQVPHTFFLIGKTIILQPMYRYLGKNEVKGKILVYLYLKIHSTQVQSQKIQV